MGSQYLQAARLAAPLNPARFLPSSSSSSVSLRFNPLLSQPTHNANWLATTASRSVIVASSTTSNAAWDSWLPDKAAKAPSLSDVVWPSLGAFGAMAAIGKIDQVLLQKGISMTIAPLGAVCAVLFLTPSSPAAKKYNMFIAQIGCAAIGVVAFLTLGPGWLARSVALAASMAFMVLTQSTHPPAASLPLLFIDGAKMQSLNYWFVLFPGAAACIILCLIDDVVVQEVVCYLKNNFKF
ncbi:hypothetical protein V2J09_014979 [Rumex salicifolius]